MDYFNNLLFYSTLFFQLVILVALFYLFFSNHVKSKFLDRFFDFTSNNFLKISFLVTLSATLGSLAYSELFNLPPCELCWFQRIFMYSLVLVLGLAIHKGEEDLSIDTTITFSFLGGLLALYHYIVQMSPVESFVCNIGETSCSDILVMGLGYITIPMMTLTIFFLIFVLGLIYKKRRD